MNPTLTINPSVRQPDECHDTDMQTILRRFTQDKNGIQEIRDIQDEDKKQKTKTNLPVVIFGGKFSERSKEGLIEASGLMVLDFDCKSKAESKKILNRIKDDKYIYSYFQSTLGLGWKALIKIPKVESDKEFKKYWYAVEDYFPECDSACKDIARACFFTYDPDLVVNPDAETWTKTRDANIQRATEKVSRSTNYGLLNKAANLIRNSNVGERHNNILSASRLAGGWVAAGRVDYQEAQRILENEAQRIDPEDYETNKRAVSDGLDHGMQEPLPDQEQTKLLSKERIQQKFDKIYWTLDDVWDEVLTKYECGLEEGYKTGYSNIDELYNMYLGYTTYIYGPAFSGKSQVWFDFLKNFSFRYGMKHAIFSPETGTAGDVFSKIIEMVAEGDIYDEYDNQMSRDALEQAKEFVNEHFIIIDPGIKSMNLDDIIASCEMVERVYDIKLHTLTIDPWNDLDHDMKDYNYRDDQYLEDALKKVRVIADYNNWHICIITHARDQALANQNGKKFYAPATFREVAGGQTWSRRGFMMSSIWRPPNGLENFGGVELEGNETFFLQQKYKPEWAGNKGTTYLRYDIKKHCYYTGTGALKNYANINEDEGNQAQQTYIDTEVPF